MLLSSFFLLLLSIVIICFPFLSFLFFGFLLEELACEETDEDTEVDEDDDAVDEDDMLLLKHS